MRYPSHSISCWSPTTVAPSSVLAAAVDAADAGVDAVLPFAAVELVLTACSTRRVAFALTLLPATLLLLAAATAAASAAAALLAPLVTLNRVTHLDGRVQPTSPDPAAPVAASSMACCCTYSSSSRSA